MKVDSSIIMGKQYRITHLMMCAGDKISKTILLTCFLVALASCARPERSVEVAPFYRVVDHAGARVDGVAAEEIISAYRHKHGLGAVRLDASLNAYARANAQAAALADQPASADALKAQLIAQGVRQPGVNLSAGYRTLAEAFSGWRDSPQHNRVLLQKSVTRIGIATAYAPRSKYKVYWALIVAEP